MIETLDKAQRDHTPLGANASGIARRSGRSGPTAVTFPSKATHQQTRAHNAALVLKALYDHGPISRAEVARMSGLTRTTVGEVVGELMADGMAREVGRGPSTGGKAPILLELVDGARCVIGLDLGETVFRGALLDLRGRVLETVEREVGGLDGLDGEQALAVVHELVDALQHKVAGGVPLLGIGIGTPGIVDPETGSIRWAVNLDWQDLPLGDVLAERYGVPVHVANDSRAAALAIHLFSGGGTSPRPANLVAITVGLGIGAGLVIGGELFHGDGFGAGEIGHTTVEEDGDECRCGRYGCLETVASSRAILHRATDAAKEDPSSILGARLRDTRELRLEDVASAAASGDEAARGIVLAAGRALGKAIASLIGVLDIERVVLHGSVVVLGESWLQAVREEARRGSLPLLTRDVAIEVAEPLDDPVVMGASALLLTAELGISVGP
jgi:N-acetylglucosamine repressor